MNSNSPYAEDFGPFNGRIWLNTAHQGPLPKVAIAAHIRSKKHIRDVISFGFERKLPDVPGPYQEPKPLRDL